MNYRVALPIPRSGPLTYIYPIAIEPGSRVLVPLGTRVVTGTVVEADVEELQGARSIIEVLDETPAFSRAMLELTRRVSEYYLCSWGETIDAALPTGLSPTSVIRVSLTSEFDSADLASMEKRAPKRAQLMRALLDHTESVSVNYLEKKLKSPSIAHQLDALQRQGLISIEMEVEQDKTQRFVRAVQLNANAFEDEEKVKSIFDSLDSKAPKQSLALGQIYLAHHKNEGPISTLQLQKTLSIPPSAIDALVSKGLVSETQIALGDSFNEVDYSLIATDEADLQMTDEQQRAFDSIAKKLDSFSVTLLDGITGSGKTLVYQRVMQQVLHASKTCLMLVPEISLTPQLFDRFRAVFGNNVTVLHSGQTVSERVDAWRRLKNGELPIVIGARSAVFAPLRNVGVVIVDEEHEPSYKQSEPAPRYHGRDVAIMRAQLEQCPVILGSATPSLESIANVQTGRYELARLTKRVDGATLPTVDFVDIREQRKSGTMMGTLSKPLIDEIVKTVNKKEGTILFLNRRGYAVEMQCEDCGSVPQCPNCDVSLTWHKAIKALKCHYCGFTTPALTSCNVCGGISLVESGVGTQRVEEDLNQAMKTVLPDINVRVERMDTDTMKKRGAHRKLLSRFVEGSVDVVVGTQMVTKGLDIPRVTLVGVVNADQSLYQADFRALERTVQLLTQVSGRAGRTAAMPGHVVIQTSSDLEWIMDNGQWKLESGEWITMESGEWITMESGEWITKEMELRKELHYPPFARFITLQFSGTSEQMVEQAAQIVYRLLPKNVKELECNPPVPPPISKIRNRFRRVIVVKNSKSADASGAVMRSYISAALKKYYEEYAMSGVRVVVDVDASGTL